MRSRIRAEGRRAQGLRADGRPQDRGSVTAEFAVALPAIVLVLGIVLAAMQLAGEQLRLQGAVADVARVLGRGESDSLTELRDVAPGASLTVTHSAGLVCARARAPAALGLIVGIQLGAEACALDDSQ